MSNVSALNLTTDRKNFSWFDIKGTDKFYHSVVLGYNSIVVVKIGLASLYGVLSVVGLLTNVIVVCLLVTIRRRALANITNLFVLALAISDVFLCGFNMPMQLYHELNVNTYVTPLYCRIVYATFGIPIHFSCFTILLIAIDRYRIIIYPLLTRMSSRMAITFIVLVFLISVIMTIPVAVVTDSMSHDDDSKKYKESSNQKDRMCFENWPSSESRLFYSILVYIVQFAMPLVITACLYSKIYLRLHERRFRKKDAERKRRTNKILMGIVMCFVLCWTPWVTFSLYMEIQEFISIKGMLETGRLIKKNNNTSKIWPIESSTDKVNILKFPPTTIKNKADNTRKIMDLLLKLLAMGSACFNPWLYGWLNDSLCAYVKRQKRRWDKYVRHKRRAFKRLCNKYTRKWRKNVNDYDCNYDDLPKDLHLIKCCGFYCAVRTGFHSHKYQVANLNMTDSPKDEQNQIYSGVIRDGSLLGRHPSGSKSSQSYHYSRHQGSKGSGRSERKHFQEQNIKEYNDNETVKHNNNNNLLEQAVLNFHKNQTTRSSLARSSYASCTTLSVFDQSTKRTSLFPSSVIANSPRGSFLYSASHRLSESCKNGENLPMTNFLCPPGQTISTSLPHNDSNRKLSLQSEEDNNEVIQIVVHKIQKGEKDEDIPFLMKHDGNQNNASPNQNLPLIKKDDGGTFVCSNHNSPKLVIDKCDSLLESNAKVNGSVISQPIPSQPTLLEDDCFSSSKLFVRSISPISPIKEDSCENIMIENECVCESDENISIPKIAKSEANSRRNSSRNSSHDSHYYTKLSHVDEQSEMKFKEKIMSKLLPESRAILNVKERLSNAGKDRKIFQELLSKRRNTMKYSLNKRIFGSLQKRMSQDASSMDSYGSHNATDISDKNDDSLQAGSKEESECDDFAHFHKIAAKAERKRGNLTITHDKDAARDKSKPYETNKDKQNSQMKVNPDIPEALSQTVENFPPKKSNFTIVSNKNVSPNRHENSMT